MRRLSFPQTVLWTLLVLATSFGVAACKDGGGGTTTPPTPTISVAISSSTLDLTQGQNNTVTVNVTRGGGYTGAVDLSLEGAPAGVSGTFAPASVPAGSTSSTLTLNADMAAAVGAHNLTVRARGQGVEEETASLALTVAEAPSISLAVEPAALSVTQATSGNVVVTIARTNFPGAVDLALEGAPAGVSGTFEPASLTGGATTSTLTLTAAADAAIGASELVIRAQGQGVEARTAAVALTVQPTPAISVAVEPAALTLNQGASGGVVVNVGRTNFGGAIELSLEGASGGVTGTFAPSPIPPEADAGTLSLAIGAEAAVGTSELVIRARGEGVEDRTAALALTIDSAPSYTLTLQPTSLSIEQGGSGTAQIQLARTNFAGAVALSVSGVPSGVTASVSPASVTENAATLTVEVGAATAPGNHTLTVTGQAQGLENRTATLQLSVASARGFSLGVTPASLTLEQGESRNATVTISRTGGFTGAVALSVTGAPSALTATVDPTSASGNAATVTVQAAGNLAPGSYPLTIRGSAQVAPGQTYETSVTLTAVVQAVTAGDWTQVSTGQDHTCAVNEAGEAYCWGANGSGQLGDGTTTQRMRPRLVTGGHTWASVTVGWAHTCGITTAGDGFCWGAGSWGRLGNGSTANSSTPEPIAVSGGDTWAMLSAAFEHTCGLTPDGRAYCWGRGLYGRIGDGTTTNRSTRVLVAGDHTWQSVSATSYHTCGLTTAGEAYCWGYRGYGAVGDGGTSGNATIPSLVQGNLTWTQVSARSDHSCGITTAGDGYCWGRNNGGQLGIGHTANQSTPALVLNDHRWSLLRPGWSGTTCGITQSGEAYCWGNNGTGQVGDGTTGNKTVPQPVAGGFNWLRVSGGAEHTCAVSTARVAYCWGRGSSGQLGNGSAAPTIYRTPIRVLDPQ